MALLASLASLALTASTVLAQCNLPVVTSSSASPPVAAAGWSVRLLYKGLNYPRYIKFDQAGHLLIVESGKGISSLQLKDYGGTCMQAYNYTTVVNDNSLNHGLAFSNDYSQLYASSSYQVKRWPYSPSMGAVTNVNPQIIVTNMSGTDHVTRTLVMSAYQPNNLIVQRGSTSNFDTDARTLSAGHSEIRAFDVSNPATSNLDFSSQGKLLGWGLRNDVGVDEEPTHGGIWAVENSVDQMTRFGVDIHDSNPAEKLNYLGTLRNNVSPNQGGNFGYPDCYAAWDTSTIPQNSGITPGSQFAIDGSNLTDVQCRSMRVAPRLMFHPHMAPLSIKFHPTGSGAWVSFHGSWDSTAPVGYKLSWVPFDRSTGQPVAQVDNTTAVIDVITNQNPSACPTGCFRPVGISWDNFGQRIYFSSDATGELYVAAKT